MKENKEAKKRKICKNCKWWVNQCTNLIMIGVINIIKNNNGEVKLYGCENFERNTDETQKK